MNFIYIKQKRLKEFKKKETYRLKFFKQIMIGKYCFSISPKDHETQSFKNKIFSKMRNRLHFESVNLVNILRPHCELLITPRFLISNKNILFKVLKKSSNRYGLHSCKL